MGFGFNLVPHNTQRSFFYNSLQYLNPILSRFLKKGLASLLILSLFLGDVAFCLKDAPRDVDRESAQGTTSLRSGLLDPTEDNERGPQPSSAQEGGFGHLWKSFRSLFIPSAPTLVEEEDSLHGSTAHTGTSSSGSINADADSPLLQDQEGILHPEEAHTLVTLEKIERRSPLLRWVYLNHLVEKSLYTLVLRQGDITGQKSKSSGLSSYLPLWVEGQGIPLKTGFTKAKAMTGFRQGTEFAVLRPMHLILQALIGYQIYDFIKKNSFQPLKIIDIFRNGDAASIRGALAAVMTQISHDPKATQYLLPFLSFPLVWGGVKAILFARHALKDTSEDFKEAVRVIETFISPTPSTSSLWKDNIRWFLPLHYMDREINYLTTKLLLEGNLSLEDRQSALKALLGVTHTNGYSKVVGLNALQKLAAGVSLKQLSTIEEEDIREELLKQKILSLQALQEQNPGLKKAWKNKKIEGLIHNVYAHYLRWTLGDFDNKATYLAYLTFKVGKLAVMGQLFYKIYKQIIDYLNCPKPLQQGFNAAMQPGNFSSLYNQKCFNAYLSVFNKIPGQPPCTLVNLLPRFKLDSNFNTFNLSGAGATGEQVAALLAGLQRYQPTIHLTHFDLSNNGINTASGMTAFLEALKALTIPNTSENSIKTLNLSGNGIENTNSAATVILGNGLQSLTGLQSLDLSYNPIGGLGDVGPTAIGQGLSFLTALQVLDLSFNAIGNIGDAGTTAIGQSLRFLTNLQKLDLSNDAIGNTADAGTTAIGQSLRFLTNLQKLDLSHNAIGVLGDNGTTAIGQGLRFLPHLQMLDLSWNQIGNTGDSGTMAIGQGLRFLSNLQMLDLSLNNIGNMGEAGAMAIGKSLVFLTNLKTLNISGNSISSGFSSLVDSITQLKTLENLFVQQKQIFWIPSHLLRLQKFWNHRNRNTDVYALMTEQDVQSYLNSLSNDTTAINLSRQFPLPIANLVTLLFKGMERFHDLHTLDLSLNNIGTAEDGGSTAIGQGLQFLPNLQALNLSSNGIGYGGDVGTVAIGQGLSFLTNLQNLDLSFNVIGGSADTGHYGYWTKLTFSDQSSNLGPFMERHRHYRRGWNYSHRTRTTVSPPSSSIESFME